MLKELTLPYAILMSDGKTIWMNDLFEEILGCKPKSRIIKTFYGNLPQLGFEFPIREIDVHLHSILEFFREYTAVQFRDVFADNRYIKENEEQRLIAGLIYIDNYDEVINSLRSL